MLNQSTDLVDIHLLRQLTHAIFLRLGNLHNLAGAYMHDATTHSTDSLQLLSETSKETHDSLVDRKTQVRPKGHHRYVSMLHSRHVYTLHSTDLQCRSERARLRCKTGRSISLPLSVYYLDKLDLDIPNDCDRHLNSSAEQDNKRS